jgi:2-C-methyl-D-erythritol 2,4-cyclodiphosphate synthase
MRIGIGCDSHRFDGARPLKLGGITIPSARGLAGHSDADVLLHAIADALFGAIGAPDLGEQFPPSDPKLRGADSRLFIDRAVAQVRRCGLEVANVDSTIITDAPKLGPYKRRMAQTIGRMLMIPAAQVSVKAKTTEGLPPGRAGMAAHAVVLLMPKSRTRAVAAKAVGSPRRGRRG